MSIIGTDTFQDAITRFRNRSIHTYVGHCLLFRGQILQDAFHYLNNHLMNPHYSQRRASIGSTVDAMKAG